MTGKVREPAVAGQFYPYDKTVLTKQLEKFFSEAKVVEKKAVAGISPHAGYVYSGPTASYLYKSLQGMKPETVVVIGPNHTSFGEAISVYPEGEWKTPFGSIEIDADLAKKVEATASTDAHMIEHSVEVQLPFLQFALQEHKFKIVPICVMDQRMKTMQSLGKNLTSILDVKKHLVIASTDFSHYVPQKQAYKNDLRAIAAIKELDVEKFYDVIQELDVSMCGYGPVAAVMTYAKGKGAKAELLKYSTSGDITGEFNAVVGYGALGFY